jgi:hypothetical protein
MDAWASAGTPRGEIVRLARQVIADDRVRELTQYIRKTCRPCSNFRTMADERAQDAVDALDCPPKKRRERIQRMLEGRLGIRSAKQNEPSEAHQAFVDLIEPCAPDCLDDFISYITDESDAQLWRNVPEQTVREWVEWAEGCELGTPRPASDLNGSPRRRAVIDLLVERGVHESGEARRRISQYFQEE